MTKLLLILLRIYKLAISPYLGRNCRFHPSCSDYASEAIRRHGALKGFAMSGRRLCKCHPWHAGGYDPVPEAVSPAPAASSSPPRARDSAPASH